MDKNTEQEMEKRVEDFQQAMKNPTKRMSRNSDVKRNAHMVDTQNFDPKVKIHVEDDAV